MQAGLTATVELTLGDSTAKRIDFSERLKQHSNISFNSN